MQKLNELKDQAIQKIDKAADLIALEQIKIHFLGKKGQLTDCMKELGNLPPEEKPKLGQQINEIKQLLVRLIESKAEIFEQQILNDKLHSQAIDVTLPGRNIKTGSIHPVNQIRQKFIEFFSMLGFTCLSGPEIETEFFNFEALNIPKTHPARAMHDTFYFADGSLLRTHTSPVQIRALQNKKPPIKVIAPGRVFRCDSDVTHTPMFHQIEGLMLDSTSNMANLKHILNEFFSFLFKKNLNIRFRPSYFPFTEPSAEFDLQCAHCSGSGCRICKQTGWLEIGGCGMVHPNVLRAVEISPDEFQGWAFGMGIDRIAMLYFGITDLRILFDNELTFLQQF